jgi:hypothetical protein
MDRDIVTGMVEDFWRAFLRAAQTSTVAGNEARNNFETRIAQTAAQLPPIEAAAFLQTVEAERERMLAAYSADPAALKKRLGVPLGVDGRGQGYKTSGRQGLGELAVRTAVRATVWESVWGLFRLFR